MATITLRTGARKQIVDLTGKVNKIVEGSGVKNGVCHLFLQHTTACLATGELGGGTEADLLEVIERMIPDIDFQHTHNPAHAWTHAASSILGPALTLPVEEGRVALGTWQSPLLVELDGPRERKIVVKLVDG